MDDTVPENERICPKCGVRQEVGEICISCGLVFAKYRPPLSNWAEEWHSAKCTGSEMSEAGALAAREDVPVDNSGFKVDIVNIIVIILLIESTMTLFGRATTGFGAISTQLSFHQKAKFLYDIVAATGMLVSVVGVIMRREWARISLVVLLALGLAEGVYMLIYMHVTLAEITREMGDNLPELNTRARWLGCAIYASCIVILNLPMVRARFRP